MPLTNDEIKEGLKEESLEYNILKFLEDAKKTKTPAYSLYDIMKDFGMIFNDINIIRDILISWTYQTAIDELVKSRKIIPISVKTDPEIYYMAK